MTARDTAISSAAQVLVDGYAAQQQMSPRQQAEAAWEPTCGMSVEELEDLIRVQRGLPARARSA